MTDVDFIVGDWIYDLETFPNIFTFGAVYGNGKGMRVFEVSDRKNDTEAILDFLRNLKQKKQRLVGFNNRMFDYGLLHYILQRAITAKTNNSVLVLTPMELFNQAQKIIESQKAEKGFSSIRDGDVMIPQLDLFLLHHFNNRAKSTSLKMLEFFMRSENIEDLPYPVGATLSDKEKDVLIKYNKHDIMETLKFYYKSIGEVRFRESLTNKYGYDATNFNSTKIGAQLFIDRLEKAKTGSCYKMVGKRKTVQQTKRDSVDLGTIVLPYVKFSRQEFNSVLNWFKAQTITETKGVFTDILESDLGDVAQHASLTTKRLRFKGKPTEDDKVEFLSSYPKGWIEEEELKGMENLLDNEGNVVTEVVSGKVKKVKVHKRSYWKCWNIAEALNVHIDGLRIDFGVGGIHAARENSCFESDDHYSIESVDVASMYPHLSIQNKIYPQHLGTTFCKIYSDLYEERKRYGKGSNENAALKLALNGTYGNSNNEFSPFYDPAFTMAITVNGQLSLCMLADKLLDIPSLEIIMMNTDGLEYIVHRDHLEQSKEICSLWEKITKLELERVNYSKVLIADVNSYIAIYDNGKIKRKGRYEYENLGYHQNSSCLVIPMAAEYELLGKGSAEEFIIAHKEKFDFFSRTKVPRSSRLILVMDDETEIQQQNICRYYISDEGGKLVKIMPPLEGKEEERRMDIDSGWKVKTCNNVRDFKWDINYAYYIEQARKLIDCFN